MKLSTLSSRSVLPLLLASAGLALGGCAAPTDDEPADASDEAITSACAIETCAKPTRLLQAKTFAARPPASYRSDVEITAAGSDRTPREVRRATSRPYTWAGERRVVLGGDAAGAASIVADDFLLVEVLDPATGSLLAARTVGAPYPVKLGGKPVEDLAVGAAVDVSPALPKGKPFRLRLTGLDAGGSARVSDVFLSTAAAPPPPPPPPAGACVADAECGGGAAMCFIDRCVTVSDETRVIANLTQGVSVAYDPNGTLQAAYESYTLWDRVAYEMFRGPWSGKMTGEGGGGPESSSWHFDRAPGRVPALVRSTRGSSVGYEGSIGPGIAGKTTIERFAVGENAAGKRFAALVATTGGKCTLWFTSLAKGAWSWSSPEMVEECPISGYESLALHVRADGGADVVAASMSVYVLSRSNPIDPWQRTTILSAPRLHHATFASTHGVDGASHLAAATVTFGADASYGDYASTYLQLGDGGVVTRSLPLGTFATQIHFPFSNLDVDPAGNVWLLQRVRATSTRPAVVRIDAAGKVVQRSLGLIPGGSWPFSSLAVSATGEIALVHVADNQTVGVRRFTPKSP